MDGGAARALVEVADGVHVATSAVYATTTTVLVAGDRCLVVDPAVTGREVARLTEALERRRWRPVAVWSTHPHWDHLLDGPGLRGVPRWGGADALGPGWRERAERQRDADPELAVRLRADPADAPAAVCADAPRGFPGAGAGGDADGWSALDWDGPAVRVLRHDAHCPGHTALIAVDAGVLVAGDLLSDVEVPLLDTDGPDPVARHAAALDRIQAGARRYGADLVVPGHGTVGAVADRLAADRRYLAGLPGPVGDARLGPGAPPWLLDADREQRGALRPPSPAASP